MIKKDFPLLQRLSNGQPFVYLDNSATTQKPKQVLEAMDQFYERYNANVHRGIYTIAQRSTMEYERAHEVVAEFIHAQKEEIIFTRGTTESLNLLATSLGKQLQTGDEIVLTEMEHHANLVPWQILAKEKKLVLRFIPITGKGELDMVKAQQLITPKTKIVSLCHISNVLGTINPVSTIATMAHAVHAYCIVDAAQSVPHLPINVQELDCDFLAFSGHKMLGPTGIGVLWGKKHLLEQLSPYQYGGDMIKEVTFEGATWNDLPWKFEAGTPNMAGAMGLMAAVEYLQALGMDKVRQYEEELTEYTLEQLQKMPGLRILGPKLRGPVIAFTLEGIHPHDVSEILDKYNIAVRAGHHCAMPLHQKLGLAGSSRISFSVYNTKEDVDAVVAGLQRAREVFQ